MASNIQDLYRQTTPAEKVFLATHPHLVKIIYEDAQKAFNEAESRFGMFMSTHNTEADAFRHCYWSALLARDIGKEHARQYTTAHEARSDNPPGERDMDLFNNAVGIRLGFPGASDYLLRELALDMLRKGVLQVRPSTGGSPYP